MRFGVVLSLAFIFRSIMSNVPIAFTKATALAAKAEAKAAKTAAKAEAIAIAVQAAAAKATTTAAKAEAKATKAAAKAEAKATRAEAKTEANAAEKAEAKAINEKNRKARDDIVATVLFEQVNTPSPQKKQRLSNQIPIHEFDGSRNASIDAGLQKASAFFSSPNVTRAICACCNELQKSKNTKVVKAEGQWLERIKNRLTWDHTAHVVCDRTRAYYHAPEAALDLKGIPLAPSGIQITLTSPEDACVNEPNDTDHVIATKSVNVTVHVSLLFDINALKKTKIPNAIMQHARFFRCYCARDATVV